MMPAVVAGSSRSSSPCSAGSSRIPAWYRQLTFPPWKPPNWLFGPAWTVIFGLIVASAALSWRDAPDDAARTLIVSLFAVNAVLNIAWSGLFFALRRPDWAFLEVLALWLSILALVIVTGRVSSTASMFLLPYLAWVSFAGMLNRAIVRLNPAPGLNADRPVRQ